MSFWTSIFGSGAKAAADAVVDTANGVSDIVERWAPSDAKKHEMYMDVQKAVSESVAAARQYDPRTNSTHPVSEFINVIVDASTRMIRPGVTILLIGGVFGWWPVETHTVDPVVLGWGEVVIGFWFGVRTLTKDIPSLIKMLVELKKVK